MPIAKDNATGPSVDEYLRNEQESQIKHEYQGGRVWTMGGVSDAHVTIAGNVFVALRRLTENNIPDCAGFSFVFKAWR
jgi:Uma2 family endonuclease